MNMYNEAVLKFQPLKEAHACWQSCRSRIFPTVSVSCSFDMHFLQSFRDLLPWATPEISIIRVDVCD